jgi:hypothetical protein
MTEPSDFTEDEIFEALSWNNDQDAREAALILSGAMDKQLGAQEDDVTVASFSEDFLVMLSLVSEPARVKAEKYLRDMRRGNLSENDLTAWNRKRTNFRDALVRQGRIKEQ